MLLKALEHRISILSHGSSVVQPVLLDLPRGPLLEFLMVLCLLLERVVLLLYFVDCLEVEALVHVDGMA